MKVKVISVFRDKFTGKYYTPGEVIEVMISVDLMKVGHWLQTTAELSSAERCRFFFKKSNDLIIFQFK